MPRKQPSAKPSTPVLTQIQRVILYVRDTERSARFYNQTLGIPIKHKEQGWVELETKGVSLCLHKGRTTRPGKDQASVGFHVDDFDAVHRALKLREVPGLGEPYSPCPGLRCLNFEDPDGNALGIEGK